MLHRKFNHQIVGSGPVVSPSGISPISKRISKVESYESFRRKLMISYVVLGVGIVVVPAVMYLLVKIAQSGSLVVFLEKVLLAVSGMF